MTIAEAKEKIKVEFCSIFTKDEVLSLLSLINNDSIKSQNVNLIAEGEVISTEVDEEIATADLREFKVHKHENIHMVVQNQENLPNPCKFIIQSSEEPHQTVYPGNEKNGWRIIEAGDDDSIYKYFGRNDLLYSEQNKSEHKSRWAIIQEEMKKKGITEIRVLVDPIK
jgi:hypothetical protein